MRSLAPRCAAFAVAFTLVACAPAEEAGSDEGGVAEATSAEQDRADLFALVDAWDAALNSGDVEAVMRVYADDPIALPPNAPLAEGAEAVREFWTAFLAQGTVESRNTPVDLTVSGDLAVMRGTFTSRITPAGGDVLEEQGKWVAVLQRQADGSWRTTWNIWNSDLPLPGTDG